MYKAGMDLQMGDVNEVAVVSVDTFYRVHIHQVFWSSSNMSATFAGSAEDESYVGFHACC
jgi:hypothetical protein